MHEIRMAQKQDVDEELEGMIRALATAQKKRRADTRRRLRRQITDMLHAQGFSVGEIFPATKRRGKSPAVPTT